MYKKAALFVLCAALQVTQLALSDDCFVLSASGQLEADGTVTVLGQLAVGLVSQSGVVLDQGVVPCWVLLGSPSGAGAGTMTPPTSIRRVPPP